MKEKTLNKINNLSKIIFSIALFIFSLSIIIWVIKWIIK